MPAVLMSCVEHELMFAFCSDPSFAKVREDRV